MTTDTTRDCSISRSSSVLRARCYVLCARCVWCGVSGYRPRRHLLPSHVATQQVALGPSTDTDVAPADHCLVIYHGRAAPLVTDSALRSAEACRRPGRECARALREARSTPRQSLPHPTAGRASTRARLAAVCFPRLPVLLRCGA